MRALFDTNILIDFLNGIEAARKELSRYERPAISVVTWIEVLVGARANAEAETRKFLAGFEQLGVTPQVAERAVTLRKVDRMRVPDAIILATAQTENIVLVTRDTKEFNDDMPGIRVPYRL